MARQKKCASCQNKYDKHPADPSFKNWCSVDCGINIAKTKADRKQKKDIAAAKRDFREKKKQQNQKRRAEKEQIKTLPELKKEAQENFNKFIRLRDFWDDCISCGGSKEDIEIDQGWKMGGAWDCGHFLTVGGFPELRYDEDNAHKQCKACNGGSGKYGSLSAKARTVDSEYRLRLVVKIGEDRVLALEGPHPPKQYRHEELRNIRDTYKAKAKARELELSEVC